MTARFISTESAIFDNDLCRYEFQVAENSASGTVIGRVQFDGGITGTIHYRLLGSDADKVTLTPDGMLILKSGSNLDFKANGGMPTLRIEIAVIFFGSDGSIVFSETQGSVITITDVNETPNLWFKGTQSLELSEGMSIAADPDGLSFSQTLSIAITNIDEPPSLTISGSQSLRLEEGLSTSADTGIIVSVDADDVVTYNVNDDRFEIVDGKLRVKANQNFDFESQPSIDLVITAKNSGGLIKTATNTINITDVNEVPVINVFGSQTMTLREGTSTLADTGIAISAVDPDADDVVTYKVNDERFEIADGKLRVKAGKSFDFESESTVKVMINGTDRGGLTNMKTVTINVTDVPEAPVVTLGGSQIFTLYEGPSASDDTGYRITATDGDSDAVTLSVNDSRFEIIGSELHVKAGQLFNHRLEPSIELEITGTDNSVASLSHTISVTIDVVDLNEILFLKMTDNPAEDIIQSANFTGNRLSFDIDVSEVWYRHENGNTLTFGYSSNAGQVIQAATIQEAEITLVPSMLQDSHLTIRESFVGDEYDNVIEGNGDTNHLQGGAGDDTFKGKGGGDRIDGGTGSDTASYEGSNAAVRIDLSTGTNYGGHATGDRLINIENLTGSSFDDRLTGDSKNNKLSGGAGDDYLIGLGGADTLDGGDGRDTADYSDSNAGVTVNLETGTGTGGHAQGDKLTSIENLWGSRYADTLTGNDNANFITGGSAGDTIDGGDGRDTANYSNSVHGVTINLGGPKVNGFVTGRGGHARGDKLANIENLAGSRHADALTGDAGNNLLRGRAGADILDGAEGDDTATYSDSNAGVTVNLETGTGTGGHAQGDKLTSIEDLWGSRYADTLTGNDNANFITGGSAGDTIDGGGGRDTVSYYFSASTDNKHRGVNVNLSAGTGRWGDAAGDTYVSIENVVGSRYNDIITGNSSDNFLVGGEGEDIIDGGSNTPEKLDSDTVSYLGSTDAVTVNLTTNVNRGGDAERDSLINIENIFGSDNIKIGDNLTGDDKNNLFLGGKGGDRMDGGDGRDMVSYVTSEEGVTVNLAANTASGGDADGDIIKNFESVEGSNSDDHLTSISGTLVTPDYQSTLKGLGGNDTLIGRAGFFTALFGGDGNDTLTSEQGHFNLLFGGKGKDKLNGQDNTISQQAFGFRKGEEATTIDKADIITGYNRETDEIYLIDITSVYYSNIDVTKDGSIDTIMYSDDGKTKIIGILDNQNIDLTTADFNIFSLLGKPNTVKSVGEATSLRSGETFVPVIKEANSAFYNAVIAHFESTKTNEDDMSQLLTVTEIA